MREILFRGKRTDRDEWAVGYYFQRENPYTEDGMPIRHQIVDLPPFCRDVDPDTVGQYTGFKDKNGDRIFEGDVIQADDYLMVVRFGKCGGVYTETCDYGFIGFYVDHGSKQQTAYMRTDLIYWLERYKNACVIGNIYDNPELVKEGSDE